MESNSNPTNSAAHATQAQPQQEAFSQAAQLSRLQEKRTKNIHSLFVTANSFFSVDFALKHSTEALTDMLERWLMNEYKQDARLLDDADFGYTNTLLKSAMNTVRLIAALSNDIENIRFVEDEITLLKKEVSNG